MRSEISKLPLIFLERLKKILPTGKFDQVANTFTDTKPTTFRVNLLKAGSIQSVHEELERKGFRLEPVHWCPEAFILRSGRLRELQETEIYKGGKIYAQSLPSMLPPIILDPKPGELILDLAAAPGSKTTQMAAMMRGNGKLIAVDNNKIRFYRLKANLELQGARHVEAMLSYGESIGRKYPEYFDKILLDAPCSSESRFDVNEPASFKYWKPAKVHEMAYKQKKLFFSAVTALKLGGVLVYSTCTFAPEENEAVLDAVLKKFQGAIALEDIHIPIPNRMTGILTWGKESFDPSVRKAVRIIPTSEMEGFFIAKLRKQ